MHKINELDLRHPQQARWAHASYARCGAMVLLMLFGGLGAVLAAEPLQTPNSAPVQISTPVEPAAPSPAGPPAQPVPLEFSPAQPPKANKAQPEPAAFDPLSTAYLLKLVSSLMLVLALMFAVVWLLKRTGRFSGRARRYPLQVLTQMPLGTRERVLLIAVGDRQMLVGVAPGQVTALGWVDPPLAPDANPSVLSPDVPFTRALQHYMGQKNKASSTPAPRATEPKP